MALRNILSPKHQVQIRSGDPLAGGDVELFEPGTSNPITSYRDSGLVNTHTHPVKLSGSGRANIWVTRDCDMRIRDANGNLIVEELNANPDDLTSQASGGLVPNGSFEIDGDADLIPDGWTLVNEAGSTNEIDTSESTDGAQSFRFTSVGTGGGSLTTTEFFPVNDVEDLRVNFDLRSTVADVRNIVRVEWYDASQVSISNTDIYDDATTNPTVATRFLLSAIPPANARFAKLRLIGCDPSDATPGSTYFDDVEVFYPPTEGVFDNITIQNNEIVSTNVNGEIDLNPNGTGLVRLKYNNLLRLVTAASGAVEVRSDGNTDAENRWVEFTHQDGTNRGYVGHTASSILFLQNNISSGLVEIDGQNAGAANRALFQGDPDGAVSLYHPAANLLRVVTLANGALGVRSDGNTDAEERRVLFEHQDGTQRGYAGYVSTDLLELRNLINGGSMLLSANNAGGTQRSLLDGDPDGDVELYYTGLLAFRTQAEGVHVIDTSGDDPGILMLQDGLTQNAQIQALAVGGLVLDQFIHGEPVVIRSEDAGGTPRTILSGDPDDTTTLRGDTDVILECAAGEEAARGVANGRFAMRYDDVEVARTATAATGGLEANNTETADGFERVATETDVGERVHKTADTTRNTTTTLTDDPHLAGLALVTGEFYEFELYLNMIGHSTPNFKFNLQFSNAPTDDLFTYWYADEVNSADQENFAETETITIATNNSADAGLLIKGVFRANATTGGTLDFQWAQDVSAANNVIVRAGSYMRVRRMK